MPLPERTVKRIAQAISLFRNYLKFLNLGPQSLTLSELKELARGGYIGKHAAPSTTIAEAYLAAHFEATDFPDGAPKAIRDGSQQYLERMAILYQDKMVDALGTDIMATLEQHFLPFTDRKEGVAVYELLADPKNKGKYLGNMLVDKVKNWRERYDLIVKTELGRAACHGALDAITHNNKGRSPSEIVVYKEGTSDCSSACKYCCKFWFHSDGSPKLYFLQELLDGGTNIGRKQAEWRPTIDLTHPRCKHTLRELKPGFGFVSGKLEYIGPDHNAIATQRGK